MKLSSWRWKIFLAVALLAGVALRLLHTSSMEWKEDEYYNFYLTQLIGHSRPWPWVGMNSGVYLANPGMSIWVFAALAKLAGATDPLQLARAVAVAALIGIALIVPFAYRFVKEDEREPWLWAYALAMVNPFGLLYQRKLWPQAFLPFFCMLAWMGWWKRDRFWGAFFWGFVGALVGQVHMAGFFSAFALFLWTATIGRKMEKKTNWKAWFIGSVLGAPPLIPWLMYLRAHPTGQPVSPEWLGEVVQLKFWVFWVTDPLGLHVGNALGLHRGGSLWAQISDFVRYPMVAGHATYLCGAAHLAILLTAIWILIGAAARGRAKIADDTSLAQSSAILGFGPILTLTGINIRRYYMVASFPLEGVWLARCAFRAAGRSDRRARQALFVIWAAQLLISACIVHYVHVNQGSTQGDYGEAYQVQRDRHQAETGEAWPDLKLVK